MPAILRRSLRAKILAVVLISTFVALLVAAVALLAYDVNSYRDFLIRDLQTQADILARTTAPALSFNNPEDATEDLALLDSRASYEAAAIYSVDGEILATYLRDDQTQDWPDVADLGVVRVEETSLWLFHPVTQSGNRLGTIYLRATYDLGARAWAYLLILVTVMVVALAASGLISLAVVGSVTGPLQSVTRTARRVVDDRDFSHRVERTSDDEIGVLVDAFNTMLYEVGHQTAELEETNSTLQRESEIRRHAEAELRDRDRRKDEFLATLAHELRNPMAPMVNSLALLKSSTLDTETAERVLEILERQQNQLVRLIDDLLDVSRITSGKLGIRKEIITLNEIVQSAVETVEPGLAASSLELVVTMPDRPLYLSADPARLAQVLSNLLNNAIKFSEAGSAIALTVESDADAVRIAVADKGAGISAEALHGVFEMFSQGDSAGNPGQAGLGVGLALARQLVELHGGTIEGTSEGRGRGATFTVTLPLVATPRDTASAAAASDRDPIRHARVLVVDDNADYAASLAHLLRTQGHEVQVANDGEEALTIAQEQKPEVGILDIGLPGIDGRELARRLRRMAGDRKLVLIAVSGWGQDDDKRRSLEAGFSMHLVKPVRYEAIEDAMGVLWREARA